MAFSAGASRDVMVNINVTPLVDVLLVLLIIFMITSPIVMHKAAMDLPQASQKSAPDPTKPIHLAIHSDGQMYWNDALITERQLDTQLGIMSAQATQPALQIDASDDVAYDTVARVLSKAKAHGVSRIDMLGTR
ncbi:ExbD/TolR family protein [Dyella caseinilytica]|uniref:Biopolymer transporter ExbD n=1 Tax=Dyella caseinilytica TaxID=1849581 RepID=A0ABX7GR11_9GAMM|nr:biopolymer transporter ExbD [Dyella caseinilytica]QRN52513.1 biopolymer transporter ExbD [Dyella caseinilytica]GGA06671.1 biopolymer transport protein exbD2 [Dyella caseinilytica]